MNWHAIAPIFFVLLSKSTSYITDPQQTAATPSDCLSMHDFMPSQEDFRRFGQDGLQDLSLLCSMPNKSSTMLNHQASIIMTPHPTLIYSCRFCSQLSHPCYQMLPVTSPNQTQFGPFGFWFNPILRAFLSRAIRSRRFLRKADQDDQAQSLGSFKTLRSAASALFSSTL